MERPSLHSSLFGATLRRWPRCCLGATLLLLACLPARATVDFQDQVLPVLQENCLPCHDRHTRTSGFSVESLDSVLAGGARHGAAVMPGTPEQSPLIKVLRGEIEPRMPLGRAFSEDRIQTHRTVDRRARRYSPDGLARGALLGLRQTRCRTAPRKRYWARPGSGTASIPFILKRLKGEGLSPAPPASRGTLIRRLFFDLLGVPPEPAEVEAFRR